MPRSTRGRTFRSWCTVPDCGERATRASRRRSADGDAAVGRARNFASTRVRHVGRPWLIRGDRRRAVSPDRGWSSGSSPLTYSLLDGWPSGLRRRPGKLVYVNSVPWVRIPPRPLTPQTLRSSVAFCFGRAWYRDVVPSRTGYALSRLALRLDAGLLIYLD